MSRAEAACRADGTFVKEHYAAFAFYRTNAILRAHRATYLTPVKHLSNSGREAVNPDALGSVRFWLRSCTDVTIAPVH